MRHGDTCLPQMAAQPPAASHRLQSVQAAAHGKFSKLVQATRKGSLIDQAPEVQRSSVGPERARHFDELPLRATCLQAIDHKKNGIREDRGRCERAPLDRKSTRLNS